MSSWADMSDDHDNHEDYLHAEHPEDQHRHDEAPRQRKRLQLKPRSAKASASSTAAGGKSKSSPFGNAKPREEVLAKKGIDAKAVDERIQKKASVVHFTRDQEAELEAIRAELTKAEADLRNANEQELPEEKYRVVVEQKKKELNELTAQYTKENEAKRAEKAKEGGGHPHYERPSERRRRLEEERMEHGGDGGGREDDNVFASFGGRRQSGGGRRGEGGHNY